MLFVNQEPEAFLWSPNFTAEEQVPVPHTNYQKTQGNEMSCSGCGGLVSQRRLQLRNAINSDDLELLKDAALQYPERSNSFCELNQTYKKQKQNEVSHLTLTHSTTPPKILLSLAAPLSFSLCVSTESCLQGDVWQAFLTNNDLES